MADQIVQKLITLLGWKVDNTGQKQYDQINQRMNNKMVSDHKKANDKKVSQDQKTAEQQKRIAEKVYEFELKVRERLARHQEKLAQQKERRVNSEFERDYKKLVNFEQKQEQIREKALQFEQRIRAKLEQIKEQQAQKDLMRSQKLADQQARIQEKLLNDRLKRENDFERRLQQAQNRMSQHQEQAKRDRITDGHALQGAGRSIKSAGSVGMQLFGGLIGESVTTAGDIEALLNQVQAHGGFTRNDIPMLSKLAKSVSLSSGFKQIDLLLAMKEMGKAGYKGQDLTSLTSKMPDFALATDSTLQQSAKLTTDMLELFGYKIQDATKVMDTLTTGLSESKLDFYDMSTALKYAAPAWKASGGKLEDLIAVLAIQSQSGIKGSTAGTGNRAAVVNLALSSISSDLSGIKSNKELKKRQKNTVTSLGLKDVYDKNDNLDYFSTMRQLGKALKGMKRAKQEAVMFDLFGKTAMNQNFLVMDAMTDPKKAKRNEELIAKTRSSFGNNNTAKMSSIMKQGFNFQSGQLENSFVNLKEAIGKNFLQDLTNLFNKMSKFFNMLSEKHPILMKLTAGFLLFGFAMSGLTVTIGSFLIFAGALSVSLGVLEIGFGALFFWFGTISIAVIALGYVFYQFATKGKQVFFDFANWVNEKIEWLTGISLPKAFDKMIPAFNSAVEKLKSIWKSFSDMVLSVTLGFYADKLANAMGQVNISPQTQHLVNANAVTRTLKQSNQQILNFHGGPSNSARTQEQILSSTNAFDKVTAKRLSWLSQGYK
jgi:TP901 family phage tail tape measure protein